MRQGDPTIDTELIRRAQEGHRESQSRLAELTTDRIFMYLYRISLDYHLAQDVCQETMVCLVRYLPKLQLKDEGALWAWIYQTAYSQLLRHHRDRSRRKRGGQTVLHTELTQDAAVNERSAFDEAAHHELTQAVFKAMTTLKLHYRQILALRCFDQLSYAQIAAITGGTQLQARLLFFRAKESLRNELVSHGLTRSHLLPALGVLAAVTATPGKQASAMAAVTAEATKVTVGTALLGAITTKLGIAVVSMAVVATVTLSTLAPSLSPPRITAGRSVRGSGQIVGRVDALIGAVVDRCDFVNVGLVLDANVVFTASYAARRNLDAQVTLRGPNPITSTLCLLLLQQGVIKSLDEPIARVSVRYRDCMPLRFARSELTWRHLLEETSGLPEDSARRNTPVWSNGKLNLVTEPGAEYHRSEAGYAVLEDLLAEITGKSLDRLLTEYIAGPIQATSLRALAPENPEVAGVSGTIADLTRFMARFLNGKYIAGELIRSEAWAFDNEAHAGMGWSGTMSKPPGDSASLALAFSTQAEHEVYMICQPCGQVGAVLAIERRAGQFLDNPFQLAFDVFGVVGEVHRERRGEHDGLHWDIP